MHPLFEEICRTPGVNAVQAHCFNRWQRQLRDEIQPMLDELEQLRVAKSLADAQAALNPAPIPRKRGRPRKHPVEAVPA